MDTLSLKASDKKRHPQIRGIIYEKHGSPKVEIVEIVGIAGVLCPSWFPKSGKCGNCWNCQGFVPLVVPQKWELWKLLELPVFCAGVPL